jgi:hypothetical protein
MLGVWKLRRAWLEKSMAALYPDKYRDMQARLGNPEEQERKVWLRWKESAPDSHEKRHPRLVRQATAYWLLEEELAVAFAKEGILASRLYPIPIFPGVSLRRVEFGEPADRLARWLRVRVLCSREEDCYRALGVIHRLGHPVTLKFSEHFADYLAAPKPNGYRAIHTAVYYRRSGGSDCPVGLPVELRVMTPAFHRINEMGFIAAVHKRAWDGPYDRWPLWWERPDLRQVCQHLGEQDVGTMSDTGRVYSFTPQGEVRFMPAGCTALDFAYEIHSDLGDHARHIKVNGETVFYGTRLCNGDLVEVHYDPQFPGPDLGWTAFVTTERAVRKVQQGALGKHRAFHPGRAAIDQALLKALRWYKQERGYELCITSARVDAFLVQLARAWKYSSPARLEAEVERGMAHPKEARITPDEVVCELLSAELRALLRDPAGHKLPETFTRVRMCDSCRPAPRERIVGLWHATQNSMQLMVHREESKRCMAHARWGRRYPLCWAGKGPDKEQMALLISGEERRGLLGEVLQVLYDHAGVSLHKVDAEAHPDAQADLRLVIETEDTTDFTPLRGDLERLPGVRNVSFLPLSPAERVQLPRAPERPPNPYSFGYHLDRSMFYGREDLLERLTVWLQDLVLPRRLMLLGPKRVGKSSLAHYFAQHVASPRRLAVPVYIDCRGLTRFDVPALAAFVRDRITADLGFPRLPAGGALSSLEQLSELLAAAAAGLPGGQRLLVLLDEVNFFLDVPKPHLSPTFIENLHYLITSRPEVCWLLITQPVTLANDERVVPLSKLLAEFPVLTVPHLPPHRAMQLIVEPARRCGMDYTAAPGQAASQNSPAPVPRAVLELTGGHPYLIQVICHKCIERARALDRTLITPDDLEWVMRQLLSYKEHSYFFPVVATLSPLQQKLVALLAAADAAGLSQRRLCREERRQWPEATPRELEHALEGLLRQGLVAASGEGQRRELRIPIGLLRAWVRQYLRPENGGMLG